MNTYIKNMFTQDFMLQSVFIRGEVSNCKYHSSGHIYFTLKDEKGTLPCVMWKSSRDGLRFTLQDGQQVVAGGSVDVYERDGKYQLYARQIVRDGVGLLYEKFEALKRELEERGMFAPEYKRPIPKYIRTLGVVTAPAGAAVRDIINVAKRRNPYIRILLYPAIVQGDMAAESICSGIRALEEQHVDVIIVGRGGGSLEDLWAFNEEMVAQAVFDCGIPVISAVGHETDTTIVDYVADLRAPTPSAAAELAVYDYRQAQELLDGYGEALRRPLRGKLRESRDRAEKLGLRLDHARPESRIREQRMRALKLEESLQREVKRKLEDSRHKLALLAEQFRGLSPLAKLSQGYSFVEDKEGRAIRRVSQVHRGDELTVNVTDGQIYVKVRDKRQKERENAVGREIC